jgi:hypothetical protein
MNYVAHSKIRFDLLVTLGWYDGVTIGLGTAGKMHFLFILLAWKMMSEKEHRIHAILPIDDANAYKLIQPSEGSEVNDSFKFKKQLESFLSGCPNGAYLTNEQAEENKTIQAIWFPEFNAEDLIPYDEDTIFFDDKNFTTWERRLEKLVASEN